MPKVRDLTQQAASFLNKEKGILKQIKNGKHKVCAFISKLLMR
jgi:hypothetical protein